MKPKIVIAGKNNIAVYCLRYLKENNQNVVAVIPAKTKGHIKWQEDIEETANFYNIPILKTDDVNGKSFINRLKHIKPDLVFSFQFDQILKKSFIEIPEMGCINLHFSLLPRNRGMNPVALTLLKGEEKTGVTLHYITEKIDAGAIISQKEVLIEHADNSRTLYDKLTKVGTALFKTTYPTIIKGSTTPAIQDETIATYNDKTSINFKDDHIEWSRNYEELCNWIRAFLFPPLFYPITYFKDEKVDIMDVGWCENDYQKNPGQITDISDSGLRVSASSGSIIIKALRYKNQVISAKEFNKCFDIGDSFETKKASD